MDKDCAIAGRGQTSAEELLVELKGVNGMLEELHGVLHEKLGKYAKIRQPDQKKEDMKDVKERVRPVYFVEVFNEVSDQKKTIKDMMDFMGDVDL